MGANIFLLKPTHGGKSTLDKAYFKYVDNIARTLNEEEENRWEIYSIIIEQLIKQGKGEYLTEIKYRISDGEDPNDIFLSIIEREAENVDGLIWSFKKVIEEFIDDDYFNKFLT